MSGASRPLVTRLRSVYPLVLVLTAVCLSATVVTLTSLYLAEVEEEKEGLAAFCRAQAGFIEAVAAFDYLHSREDHPGGWLGATLGQVREAFTREDGWTRMGQAHLFSLESGDPVEILPEHPPGSPFQGLQGHPDLMIQGVGAAIRGTPGSSVVEMKNGRRFLVAFEPVELPDRTLALAISKDAGSIREPFLKAGIIIGGVVLGLLVLGSVVTERILRPTFAGLEESERRYRRLFRDTSSPVLITGMDGEILEINGAGASLLGRDPEELKGRNVGDFYQDPQQREELIRALNDEGRVEGMEVRLTGADGETIECLASVLLRAEADGSEARLEAFLTNVTEIREAQARLLASEAMYFDMFEHAPDLLLSLDPETGEIRECNQAFLKRAGHSRDEVLGQRFSEFCSVESQAGLQEAYDLIRSTGAVSEAEVAILGPDGSPFPASLNGLAVLDEEGHLLAVRLSVRDVTELKEIQEALRMERDRAQQYLDVAEVLLLALDSEGRIEMINRKGCEILGRTEGELLGRDWFEVAIPQGDRGELRNRFQSVIRAGMGTMEYHEHPVISASGEERVLAWHNAVIRESSGKIRGTFSSGEDITEKIRVQQELKEKQQFLDQTGEMARVGGWEVDLETGRVYWTRVTKLIHEVPEDYEPTVETAVQFFHPQDRPVLERALRLATDQGEPYDLELRLTTARGRELWTRAIGQPEFQDGQCTRLWGTFQDVTDRREVEEALRRSESRFRSVYENSPLGIILLDAEGRMTSVNPRACEILGREPEELLGRTPYDFTHPEDAERSRAMNRRLLKGERGGFRVEKRYLRPDNTSVWVRLTTAPVMDSHGEVLYGIGMTEDISRWKEAQEELKASAQRLRALAERLAEVREEERTAISRELHDELGQVLTGLRMDLSRERSLLSEGQSDLKARLAGLVETTDQTVDLVRDLSSRLRPPILDVMGLGPALIWLVEEQQDRIGAECILDVSEARIDLPEGHDIAVFRIAQEALTNIIRHADAETVWVTLGVEDDTLRLSVEDDGKGISPDVINNVSTSLGLLGMQERALAIGGEVTVGPRAEGGTVVQFTMDLKESPT